jgi:hypothetical protein
MKRPLDIASLLVFVLPLPYLLRESSLFFVSWSLIEFALSFAAGRLELKGRLDSRARAQAELVIRTASLPLTVMLLEAAGMLLLAALLRYALTCALMGYLRLRWLILFLILFPAGSALFSFFQSYPEIPFHAAGPLFAAVSLGLTAGLLMRLLRQGRTLAARFSSGMRRAARKLQSLESRLQEMLCFQMDQADARLFARGGALPSRVSNGIVFSLYLRDSDEGYERLSDRDFDREWEQFLDRTRQTSKRYAMTVYPAGSCIRFLRAGCGMDDQAAALAAAREILGLLEKTRMHHASLRKSWPMALGFVSRAEVREVSAGPGVPQRLLLGSVLERHDRAAVEAWTGPQKERWVRAWPLIDENLPALRAGIEKQSAHVLGEFVLPGKPDKT